MDNYNKSQKFPIEIRKKAQEGSNKEELYNESLEDPNESKLKNRSDSTLKLKPSSKNFEESNQSNADLLGDIPLPNGAKILTENSIPNDFCWKRRFVCDDASARFLFKWYSISSTYKSRYQIIII
jgi:hypothetical protein